MNNIQSECMDLLRQALTTLKIDTRVGATGGDEWEPQDGASADFETPNDGCRRVYVYRDEDGTLMLDAIDAEVGVPNPQPYTANLALAYCLWGTGTMDDAFNGLVEAGRR